MSQLIETKRGMKGYQVNKLSSNGCSNTPFPFHDAICQCIFPQQRLSCRDRDNILLPLRRSIRGRKGRKKTGTDRGRDKFRRYIFWSGVSNISNQRARCCDFSNYTITQLNSLETFVSHKHTLRTHMIYEKNKRRHEGTIVI